VFERNNLTKGQKLMGWDFSEISKKALGCIDFELQNFSRTESVLWSLIDTEQKDYGKRVLCFLIERRKIEGKFWWGYKDIDDMMGPCAVTCPLRLIDASTKIKNEYLQTWQKDVRKFWKDIEKNS
jgi:hypothetical protein